MPQRSRRSSSGGVGGEKTPNPSKQPQQRKGPVTPPQNGGRRSPTALQGQDLNKDQIVRAALDEASTKYPGFISRDAFEGSIVEVESQERACGATLWMSEAAMFAHSLSPGCAVAVSVAVSTSNFSSSTFPLESLANLCSKHYNIELEGAMIDEVGTYFAIAIAWPSCKLLKNGIRLSRHLSNTMGSPSLGRTIYVFPLHIYSTSKLVHRVAKMPTLKNGKACQVSLCECNDLNLKWFAPKSALRLSSKIFSPSRTDNAGNDDCENGHYSSPKTPSGCQSKVIDPIDTFRGRSPLEQSLIFSGSPQIQKSEGSIPHTATMERTSEVGLPNWVVVRTVLEDEKQKGLLQRYAVRWLSTRILLRGNFVTIPVCGQMCVFHVTDTKNSSEQMYKLQYESEVVSSCNFNSLLHEEVKDELHLSRQPLVFTGFLVGSETNVNFLLEDPTSNSQFKECLSASDLMTGNHGAIKLEKAFPTSERLEAFALGGLSEEIASLKEIINFSLLHPHTLKRLGLQPTRGVLLYGPPGTGKTSLVSACAYETGINMFLINGPEIVSEYYGESEQALQAVFRCAGCAAPSMVFIDELDAIAPTRKDGSEDLSQRMVAALLALIDGINKNHGVLVVAATNRPESIDPALRRPGRLDREIEIGVPSPTQRLEILQAILHRMNHSLTNGNLQSIASNTHGFVGADIAALCNEAAMSALRRYINIQGPPNFGESHDHKRDTLGNGHLIGKDIGACYSSQDSEAPPPHSLQCVSGLLSELSISENSNICCEKGQEDLGNSYTMTDPYCAEITAGLIEPTLTMDDFEVAKMKVRPSAMREVMLEVPKVCWSDIGGQDEVKQQLKETVEWPQKHQDAFLRIGTHAPRGVLMFGPPGCSKTLMARAVASEAGLNFLAVKGPELFSKWVGESEKAVRSLFAKARAAAPSIIFFDEIDGLAVAREHSSSGVSVGDRVMSQLLVEMDGSKHLQRDEISRKSFRAIPYIFTATKNFYIPGVQQVLKLCEMLSAIGGGLYSPSTGLNPRVGVTVIAATNRPDKIDAALLRPGRFDRLLYVGLPDESARKEIFHIHMRKMPCGPDLTNLELASLTDGYTGADISAVCREAALAALEENLDIQEVSMRHFKVALAQVQPSDLSAYETLSITFQRRLSSNVVMGRSD